MGIIHFLCILLLFAVIEVQAGKIANPKEFLKDIFINSLKIKSVINSNHMNEDLQEKTSDEIINLMRTLVKYRKQLKIYKWGGYTSTDLIELLKKRFNSIWELKLDNEEQSEESEQEASSDEASYGSSSDADIDDQMEVMQEEEWSFENEFISSSDDEGIFSSDDEMEVDTEFLTHLQERY